MFVANFVVQLDNFWTAGRYFNKLYFINVCVKVFLILVFSFCRLNICCLILSLAQTQNLKLISFFCRSYAAGLNQVKTWNQLYILVIRSAEIEHQIRFSISRTSKFSEARKVVGKARKEVTSYEGKVRKMVLVFTLTEAGEQQIGWVLGKYQASMGAVGMGCHICQTSMPKWTVQLPNILDTILLR